MDLNEKDRLIISNQLKILEKLYPEEAAYYAQHRKAVEHGYRLHYAWLIEHFYEEMTEEECREALDVLEMYRAITFSFRKLEDKTGIDEAWLRFAALMATTKGNSSLTLSISSWISVALMNSSTTRSIRTLIATCPR